jgi:hypothetical protein
MKTPDSSTELADTPQKELSVGSPQKFVESPPSVKKKCTLHKAVCMINNGQLVVGSKVDYVPFDSDDDDDIGDADDDGFKVPEAVRNCPTAYVAFLSE